MRTLLAAALAGAAALSSPIALAQSPGAALGAAVQGLLEFAARNQPELRAARLEADAAQERVTPAGALPDPMFEVEWRDVTNEGSGGGFNLLPGRVGSTRYKLTQSLPWWGKRDLQRDVARAGADEARERVDGVWNELAMRIKLAYARYRQTARALALTREIEALIERAEAVAQARYSSGRGMQAEVIRAQVERTGMRSDIAMLEAELAAVRVRINGLLARPTEASLAEPVGERDLPPEAKLDPAVLRERLLARNPQLRGEAARVRGVQSQRDLAYRNRYPDVRVGLAPIQMRNRIAEWELMLEVNIPLQQETRRAQEREAEAMLTASEARRAAVANDLGAQLGESLAGLTSARRVALLARHSLLPQSEASLQAALVGYENGRVDLATLLEAQRQIRTARLALIRAEAEGQMKLAEVERLLGEDL